MDLAALVRSPRVLLALVALTILWPAASAAAQDGGGGSGAQAEEAGCAIVLPSDAVIAREFKAGAPSEVVAVDAVPADAMILDAGPETIAAVKEWIGKADTLVWNGPLGAFEIEPFDRATVEAARYAAEQTREGKLISVAGGGDTVAALNHAEVAGDFTYVSTAGGAFLEWMEGKALPGVQALKG